MINYELIRALQIVNEGPASFYVGTSEMIICESLSESFIASQKLADMTGKQVVFQSREGEHFTFKAKAQ